MKNLVIILLGGTLAFLAVSMVQEWRVFAPWLGLVDDKPAAGLSDADRQAAEQTVRELLMLMRHLYLSSGDARFAERMPAGRQLVDELRAEVEYLTGKGWRQDPQLKQLDVLAIDAAAASGDRVVLRTRERWAFDLRAVDDGRPLDETQIQLADCTYRLTRQATGWRVVSWDLARSEVGLDASPGPSSGPAASPN